MIRKNFPLFLSLFLCLTAAPLFAEQKLSESQLLEALRDEPANPDYHFELANLYAERFDQLKTSPGHPKRKEALFMAANHLEQAIMIRPDFAAAQFNLGIVYKRQGEYEKARGHFQKVLMLDPHSSRAWLQIGEVYEEQGFFDDAKDAYLRAKELNYADPEVLDALENLEAHTDYAAERAKRESAEASSSRFGEMYSSLYNPNPEPLRTRESGLDK